MNVGTYNGISISLLLLNVNIPLSITILSTNVSYASVTRG